jgi:hypothetical protein
MSELTDRFTRLLYQAQVFVKDAPLEAIARAQLVEREASAALPGLRGEEHDAVSSLLALARSRVERYQASYEAWETSVRERAALFAQHERERLQQPLPSKI